MYREPVFNQLGLPRSSLNSRGELVVTPKGTILGSLGTIKLEVPCRCDKWGCHAQEVQFDVIQGLLEQGIMSNADGQRLGWLQKEEDSQKEQEVQNLRIPPEIRRLVEGYP